MNESRLQIYNGPYRRIEGEVVARGGQDRQEMLRRMLSDPLVALRNAAYKTRNDLIVAQAEQDEIDKAEADLACWNML